MSIGAINYTGVLRIVNQWAPFHIQGKSRALLSMPSKDIKVAQAVALTFAKAENLFFDEKPYDLDRPFLTVVKSDEKWFPAELHSDRVCVLEAFMDEDLGGDRSEAEDIADLIAQWKELDFLPKLGVSLNIRKPTIATSA